jgi:hypothetical protein
VTPGTTQFGLRQSIRNSSGFGSGLNFMGGKSTNDSSNASLNDSMKGSPILSPKMGKGDSREEEVSRQQYLMKKRSPTKPFEEKEVGGVNTSVNYQPNNLLKGEQFGKNDRSNRFELLLKNHAKCSTLNQMVLDMFRFDQNRCVYIAYYLLKSIEKELHSLAESLKKESPDSNAQDGFREFKSVVEK